MSGSNLFLFGSFTEDETKALFRNKRAASSGKHVENGRSGKAVENKGPEISACSTGESGQQPESRIKQAVSLNKDNQIAKLSNGLSALGVPKENGKNENPNCCPPLIYSVRNGKADCISENLHQNEYCPSNESQGSKFHVLERESVESRYQNGSITDPVAVLPVTKEINQAANQLITAVQNLSPRGLINCGNLCFLNSTLQALLSCPPFVHLLQKLRHRNLPKVGYPTLTAFAEFISDFDPPVHSNSKSNAALEIGRPFSPMMFEGVLEAFTPDIPNSMSGRPRQEDAQEFLSFIMDQMHDELLKLEGGLPSGGNGATSSLVSSAEDDEWETVGPKNKSAVTRTQSFVPSELSDIFGGQLRSVVKARGNKASATVQPYLLLHLDIHPEAVRKIEDALHLFCAPEYLEGYRASTSGKADIVAAKKSVKIQTLSKVMILHLMRFSYGSQGSTKLHKPVHFPLELVLGRELLVSSSAEGRKYELVATITHHGREPSKGHYTADARYPNGQWLRFDDASVVAINTNKVLHEQAYVLIYKQV